jgi:XRE family transcriptional regulator, regulator of sulfur utilization
MTRRDLYVAMLSAAATAAAFAVAGKTPVMGSAIFDWNTIPAKPTDVGSVRSFFNAPTATLEELELHVTTLDSGKMSHPPHRHPNEELIIIKQGTVETLQDGQWKRVGPGSVIFNASNQLHGLRNVGTDQAIYHVINWKSATTPAPSEP